MGASHVLPTAGLPRVRLRARIRTPLSEVVCALFYEYRRRTLVGLSLMGAQAFFSTPFSSLMRLILKDFYGLRADRVGWFILPFAAGNFLGPLFLGRLFDVIGRRPMIAFTYIASGVLLTASGALLARGTLSAARRTFRLDFDLLLRLGRGELGLSHRERDISTGDSRACDCILLRDRDRGRRVAGPCCSAC